MDANKIAETMAGVKSDNSYNYTDFTEVIRKKTQSLGDDFKVDVDEKYIQEVDKCIEEIGTVIALDPKVRLAFEAMENYKEFSKVLANRYTVKSGVLMEAFYELKLGARYDGIRARDVYIIKKAIKEKGTEFPNYTIWSVYKLLVGNFQKFKDSDQAISIYQAINFLFGRKVDLIYGKVKHKVEAEAYVESEDKIALLSEDIAQVIMDYKNAKELSNNPVEYDSQEGLYIQPKGTNKLLLRTINNRLGIVVDDFDLREAY